jgi:hypothetical protein
MAQIKTYRITSLILVIICTAMLIHSNYQKNKTADIIDQYFDLRMQYERTFDEVQILEQMNEKLEDQLEIMTSFISEDSIIKYDLIDPTIE